MKKNLGKLTMVTATLALSMAVVGCGASNASTESQVVEETVQSEVDTEMEAEVETEVEAEAESKNEAEAEEALPVMGEGPLGLNYTIDPEEYVGNWVLVGAYTATDDMLEVTPEACYLDIEISVDTNKLVDDAAYIHADAINLQGTMSFNVDGIDVEPYKCSGSWTDWTVVDIVGENDANFGGAVKFRVRDNDEGVFFEQITGTTVADMELFDVVGINAEGQLVLGYSEGRIVNSADAEWEYAYIFEKK